VSVARILCARNAGHNFTLRERASVFDPISIGRTEDVTACTPRNSPGP